MISKLWKKKEKFDPPENRAIIKINETAKEKNVNDNENKIIELIRGNRVEKIKYSEADVEALRNQGIPVVEEEYSGDFEWVDSEGGGGVETRR